MKKEYPLCVQCKRPMMVRFTIGGIPQPFHGRCPEGRAKKKAKKTNNWIFATRGKNKTRVPYHKMGVEDKY